MPEQNRTGPPGPGRDVDAIRADIEATQQQLAATIDALAGRVSPKNNVRKLRERATGQLVRPQVQVAVAAAGVLVAGAVAWRIWGRRR